jgi:MFS family permease
MHTATPVEPDASSEPAVSEEQSRLMLWLTNASHGTNHFQGQIVGPLYPLIMADLGFSYAELGMLVALRNALTSWTQLGYGFVTPFIDRCRVLGIANLVLALGTLLTGLTGSFVTFLGARVLSAAGSSAQHPVGASLLSSYFPKSRGAVLALNNTIASGGMLIAPVVAGVLITMVGWRQVFWVVAGLSVVVGIAYFFVPDRTRPTRVAGESKKAVLAKSLSSYLRVLRNKNLMLIGLVFMVGAAGRGGEDIQSYFATHFVNDLGMNISIAAFALGLLQVGGLGGPVFFGWLSDRVNRKAVIQVSLVLSALSTVLLAHQDTISLGLALNLLFQGAVTSSRGTLTQALIADSASDADQDAAFSVYFFLGFFSTPLWALGTGFLMEAQGFTNTFTFLSVSYVAAMLVVFFVSDPQPARTAR